MIGLRPKPARGFSLPEIMVTIAIVGIMASIAISQVVRTDTAARSGVANTIVTTMNRAVTAYRQCGSEVTISANADASADEASVMSLLTSYDPGVVGTPFLKAGMGDWPSVGTTTTTTYRARWNGRFFEVIPAGTAGTGLKINKL
jgi:prepilin-type N-terminal cleavage/methylation domain-containing protein